jgi:magnesium transporter
MSDPLFTPEARLLLEKNDTEAMATFCDTLHPATVAEALSDDFPVEDVWRFLDTTTIAHQAAIFAYFPLQWQVRMVEGTGRPHMARLIEKMSHDDRADLLRRLDPQVADGLLRLVDEADRRDIATLVKYPENSAGALMTTDYAWLPAPITVEVALDRLRLQAPDRETIYYVYVVDDRRRLLGVVSLRDLILAQRQAILGDIMETNVVTVRVTDDREKVAQDITRYDLLAVPVVDENNRLVGIVTYDDVIDVVVSEATEDVHRMGAVNPITENYLEARFAVIWRKRAVWLACLFLAELFTFTALSYFEDAIAEIVVLSLFVPLCISTGGNSGSQAATLITRAMALGQVTNRDWGRVLRHEIAMGLVLGLTLGGIGFIRASFTPHDVRGSSPPRFDPFTVTVTEPLQAQTKTKNDFFGLGKTHQVVTVSLPAQAAQVITGQQPVKVELPEDAQLPEPTRASDGRLTYTFPKKCTLPRPPVDRWRLSAVIGLAVAGICLWGTLVGSMLPLVFRRLGIDPGVASSPFVATFVDVTGIIIYFSIAKAVLADILMGA